MAEGVMMMEELREMWEAAQALTALGLWVKIESHLGRLTVYRDGVEIGTLTYPVPQDPWKPDWLP